MLMAAGLGTRLSPFTEKTSKPLLPLMGVPVSQFAVDLLNHHQVKKAVANVHHHSQLTREGLLALELEKLDLEISDETQLLMGSAGGPKKALKKLGRGPFFYLNADTITDVNLSELAEFHTRLHKDHGVDLTMAIAPNGSSDGEYREIFVDDRGLVTGTGEVVRNRPYFLGVAVMEPSIFKKVPKNEPSEFLPSVLFPSIVEGKVGAYMSEANWFDIGTADLWAKAHFDIIEGIENGRIEGVIKDRVEKNCEKISDGVWCLKGKTPPTTARLAAPAFWDSSAEVSNFGPRAIAYGEVPSGGSVSQTLFWNSLSTEI